MATINDLDNADSFEELVQIMIQKRLDKEKIEQQQQQQEKPEQQKQQQKSQQQKQQQQKPQQQKQQQKSQQTKQQEQEKSLLQKQKQQEKPQQKKSQQDNKEKIKAKNEKSSNIRKSAYKNKSIVKTKKEPLINIKKKSKKRKISKNKIRKNPSHFRYTVPKKRNYLSKKILAHKLEKGYFNDIEEALENKIITQEDIKKSEKSSRFSDRKLYKKVQSYEDAINDVTSNEKFSAYKIGMTALLLSGLIALEGLTIKKIEALVEGYNDSFESTSYVNEENNTSKENSKNSVYITRIQRQIIENDGYHFDTLSTSELEDAYVNIINNEKKITENDLKKLIHRVNSDGDQKLLDEIVEKSVGTEYKILTDSQKRDYRQFAYELLSISLPDIPTAKSYIRNPIAIDYLSVSISAKEKGYKINLKINNDEHENVKNIGNLIHIINTLNNSYFNEITQEEYAQLEFYNSILKKALGNNYDNLNKRDKRDYQQILYELLPEEKKKYVIDPIDLDKQIKNSNDIVIGDN